MKKTSDLTPSATASRRGFLKGIVATGAAPLFIPASALGRDGRPAPSERITVGCIGFGTIAHTTVKAMLNRPRAQVVAVADPATDLPHYGYSGELRGGRNVGKQIIEAHYAAAKDGSYKGCDAYADFRQILDRSDIDAVNISTPDHWHGVMTIMAAAKGKHIYGQKPFSLNIGQGRAMVEAVKKAGVTFQCGSQQRSDVYFRQACEFVRNGRLGKLKHIRAALPGGHNAWNKNPKPQVNAPLPEGLDWEMWQGPAPVREFSHALFPLCWRHNYDYSGGMVTDFGAHHVDIAQWALNMDESGPIKLENITSTLPAKDAMWNTATKFHIEAVYADGNRLIIEDVADYKDSGLTFVGEGERSIFVTRGQIKTTPADMRSKERIKPEEIHLYESLDHEQNFLDSVYSGQPTVAPAETAHRTISICQLANIAIRLGKSSVTWDPKTEKSTDDEVNALLTQPIRGPWKLS